MRGAAPHAALAAGLIATAAAAAAFAGPPRERSARSAASSAVGVGLREHYVTPYRRRVPRGTIRFNVTNYGEDGHDLAVRGPGADGPLRGTTPEIRPGGTATLRLRLPKPGVYTLVCTLADHEARGMLARVRVTKN